MAGEVWTSSRFAHGREEQCALNNAKPVYRPPSSPARRAGEEEGRCVKAQVHTKSLRARGRLGARMTRELRVISLPHRPIPARFFLLLGTCPGRQPVQRNAWNDPSLVPLCGQSPLGAGEALLNRIVLRDCGKGLQVVVLAAKYRYQQNFSQKCHHRWCSKGRTRRAQELQRLSQSPKQLQKSKRGPKAVASLQKTSRTTTRT